MRAPALQYWWSVSVESEMLTRAAPPTLQWQQHVLTCWMCILLATKSLSQGKMWPTANYILGPIIRGDQRLTKQLRSVNCGAFNHVLSKMHACTYMYIWCMYVIVVHSMHESTWLNALQLENIIYTLPYVYMHVHACFLTVDVTICICIVDVCIFDSGCTHCVDS